jgi:hypothetical protein
LFIEEPSVDHIERARHYRDEARILREMPRNGLAA